MKNLAFLLALLFASVPALACDDADNYAGQFAVRGALGKELFDFDGMTAKEIGDAHWFARAKLLPWAGKIADPCVRSEALGYIRSEIIMAKDAAEKLRHPDKSVDRWFKNSSEAQDAGRTKLEALKLPPAPK